MVQNRSTQTTNTAIHNMLLFH